VTRVPHARTVSKALRAARVGIKGVQRALNQMAGQRTAKGDYASAETLVSKAREIGQFQSELDKLAQRWREVCGARGDLPGKQPTTPLWQYFQPILRSLGQAGGECRRPDLEAHVHGLMVDSFLPGDSVALAHGRERWRVMVQRARKHLVAEGWIENRHGPVWKITDAGRQAAEKPISKGPAT
jgi:hypothetical protein